MKRVPQKHTDDSHVSAASHPQGVSVLRQTKKPDRLQQIEEEKDAYVVNLKGQVYLLTIENELLKQSQQQAEAAAKTSPRRSHHVDVEPPEELSDLEAMMRAKYAQLENKYVGELTEAKRAAEALATQCAAQSSLVSALKTELERANSVISQQRQGLQMTKEQASVELQHAHDEAEHLRDDIRT